MGEVFSLNTSPAHKPDFNSERTSNPNLYSELTSNSYRNSTPFFPLINPGD